VAGSSQAAPRRAVGSIAVLGACIGLVAGCVSNDVASDVLPPDVHLTDVAPVGGGLFEQRIRLTFRFTNPNAFDLAVDGFSFQLDMNGEPLAHGVSAAGMTLPALSESLVDAEASTTTLGLLHQLKRLSERRELSYDLSGRVHLSNADVPWLAFERHASLGPSTPATPRP